MESGIRSNLRTIFACLSHARRRELALLFLVMPATAIAEGLAVAAIVPFIALLSGQPVETPFRIVLDGLGASGADHPTLAALALFACIVALTAALRLALTWFSRHFAFAVGHEVSTEILRHLLGQPYAFHLRRHSSEHLAALDKVDLLVFDFIIQGVQAASALMIAVCILALLVVIDPFNAALAVAVIAGFYAVALVVTRRQLRSHGATINAAYEQRSKFVQESLGGIRDLILDHSQAAAVEQFRAIDASFAEARTKTAFLAAAPRYLVEAAGLIIIALLAVMIAGRSGGITAALPFLAALALGALRLLPLLGQIYSTWASVAVVGPILTVVGSVLRLPIREVSTVSAPMAFHRAIEFRDVCFNYPDHARRAVEGVEMTIPKGARVAITGRTGSGKSTLADLLMGLIEPTQGSILIDGSELTRDGLPGWQRSIAHVPQQIFLADDSVAANIALSFHGGAADADRIRLAARAAQLHDFIETLPQGYETRIGERGIRLSGGQRQRLALARALYKQAPLLVLDEPTSALDDETETAVIETMRELQANGTTIVIIAHRHSTMAHCDPIYAMEEGRIVKSGSYAELFGQPTTAGDR